MTTPNGHGGRRPVAGRPKSRTTLLRETAEQLLTAAVHRLRENQRSESESLQPILRRLTEIERHLRLTETPEAPRPSRRHPMEA